MGYTEQIIGNILFETDTNLTALDLKFQSFWNASSGEYPAGVAHGDYYGISVGGALPLGVVVPGDWIFYSSTAGWSKGAVVKIGVSQINGKTGYVTLNTDDVSDIGYLHKFITQTEKDKLSAIEAGAQVNDTALQIKTKYESNADTNAFTDVNLTKLNGIEDLADVNVIETVKFNGVALPVNSKEVNIVIGAVFILKGTVSTYSALPSSGQVNGDTYQVLDTGLSYYWLDTDWESMGGTIDLSNYYTKTEVYSKSEIDTSFSNKVDKAIGKQLSTNDYTSTEKTKLTGIEDNAQVNDYKLKVSNTDNLQGFLSDKIIAGENITLSVQNVGGNEKIEICSTASSGGSVESINGILPILGNITLTKTDIGLENVTNNAQVKKIENSTDKAIMRWNNTTGDTPQDSLVTISDTGTVNVPTGQNYNINGINLKDVSETLTNKTLNNPIITGNPTGITSSHVGLGNVTNNAQMKKISNSINDNIITWDGITGDTPKDSGKSIGNVPFKNEINTFTANVNVNGTLQVNGNIVQNGSAYETHAEQIFTKDDTIILRDGAVAGMTTGQYAGFTAKLYDGTNDGQLVFDKDGIARVGDVGSTQAIATREDTPTDGRVAVWDSATSKFVTSIANTGTGNFAKSTSPILYTPIINGEITGTGVTTTGEASKLVKMSALGNISMTQSVDGFIGTNISNTSTGVDAISGSYYKCDSTNTLLTSAFGVGGTSSYFGYVRSNYTGILSYGTLNNGLLIGTLSPKPVIFGTNNIERYNISNIGVHTFSTSATTNYNSIFRNSSYSILNSTGNSSIRLGYSDHDGAKIEAYKNGTASQVGLKLYGEYGIGTDKLLATFEPVNGHLNIVGGIYSNLGIVGATVSNSSFEDTTRELYIGDGVRKVAMRVNQKPSIYTPVGTNQQNGISGNRDFQLYSNGIGTGSGGAPTTGTVVDYDGFNLHLGAKNTTGDAFYGSVLIGTTGTAGAGKLQVGGGIYLSSGYISASRGANVASATTITPTGQIFHVTGTTAIATINIPFTGYNGTITIIPDAIFTTTTAGNIALASTAVVNRALIMTYDSTTAKWYPSY